MNQNDLYLKYAEIIEMCKGTALEGTPWVCVRFNGSEFYDHPRFDTLVENYQFAIAVLEDRPIFIGDTLYDGQGNPSQVTEDGCAPIGRMIAICSGQPPKPKRTFELHGVELPCPVAWRESSNGDAAVIDGEIFWFKNKIDADLVRDTLSKIFREARDKP